MAPNSGPPVHTRELATRFVFRLDAFASSWQGGRPLWGPEKAEERSFSSTGSPA